MDAITILRAENGDLELMSSRDADPKALYEMADAAARFYRAAWTQWLERQLAERDEPEEADDDE